MRPGNQARRGASGAASLDTQTVTTGSRGTAPRRTIGYTSGGGAYGSIADGTSNIYSGASIMSCYWDENGGAGADLLFLQIAGTRANSGWTTVTINGTAFSRASATYAGAGNTSWEWDNLGLSATALFGANGSSISVVFT